LGNFILAYTMRAFQLLCGILIAFFVGVTVFPASAQAASSTALRVYDDVESATNDYSGQNLLQVEFGNANLTQANFSGANLRGAVFNGANLANANLKGVDFSDGIGYLTNFSGADLSNAVFTSAMLLKSSFKDAIAVGTDFSDATLERGQVLELCQTASGTNPVTGVDTRESLGCR
jgi:uncharacterized protein YjbI with pentapeptide repeats